MSLTREVKYITDRARSCDARVVARGPLILFSTESGDAWMLDPSDQLALCLARDGSRVRSQIEENEKSVSIEWTHTYQLADDLVTFVDRSGKAQTLWSYPTAEIRQASRISRPKRRK